MISFLGWLAVFSTHPCGGCQNWADKEPKSDGLWKVYLKDDSNSTHPNCGVWAQFSRERWNVQTGSTLTRFFQVHQHGMNVDGISSWPTIRAVLEWTIFRLTIRRSFKAFSLSVNVHFSDTRKIMFTLKQFGTLPVNSNRLKDEVNIGHTLWSPFAAHLPLL